MIKKVVYYTAMFKTTIELPENASEADIRDVLSDIDIPEDKKSTYVRDTFDVDSDAEGNPILTEFNWTEDMHRVLEAGGDSGRGV
jgi:hypothetical protein